MRFFKYSALFVYNVMVALTSKIAVPSIVVIATSIS